jgi:hypothetical protein
MNQQNLHFLTCDELASRWSKPKKWIYNNWRSLGIPVCHLGQQLRFPIEGIKEWEAANTN